MCSPAAPVRDRPVPWLDRLGIATSTICAVHCAATGLLYGVMSAAGVAGIAEPWVESLFITATLVLGGVSLGHALRRHRSPEPLAWFAAGLVLLLALRPLMPSAGLEVLATALGAFCVVRAHWRNARLGLTSALPPDR